MCVCVCAVSWPCRADRPSSHGAGSSCVLCCRSGSLSHWSVAGTVSCRKQPRQQQNSSFSFSLSFCLSSIHFFSATNFPPYLPDSHPSMSPFCLLNLLFFLYYSLSYSFPPLFPWPHRPFLSVCIHHLSAWIWLVFINRALQSFIAKNRWEQMVCLTEKTTIKAF